MPDAMVLGFDTSGPYCAGLLRQGTTILAERHDPMPKGQAERLFPMLEEMLAEAGKDWGDLDRIGVGIGPGNFTGVRLSVSAARGLSLSLGIPAIGVSLLDAAVHGSVGPVLAAFDARRGAVYLQLFGREAMPDIAPGLFDLTGLPAEIFGQDLAVIGSAGSEVAAAIGGRHLPAPYAPASAIARLAAQASPGARPKPLYLREADAKPSAAPAPVILP